MSSKDKSSEGMPAASFGRAGTDLARQYPFKVMAIVGSVFFCAGVAASLSLGSAPQTTTPARNAAPEATTASVPTAPMAQPPSAAASPSPADTKLSITANTSEAPDCDKQTWPYLDRACLDALATKSKANPQVRVISTDRDAPSTVQAAAPIQPKPDEASKPASTETEPTPIAPAKPTAPAPEHAVPALASKPDASPSKTAAKDAPAVPPKLSTDAKAASAEAQKPAASVATVPPATASESSISDTANAAPEKNKKTRAQRAKPERESADSVLVRDITTYPDGRQVSVIRRVKKEERRLVPADDEDDEEVADAPPAWGFGSPYRTRHTSRTE